MRVEKLDSLTAYQNASLYTNLFSKAVKRAKEINRKNGLPNDFVRQGKRYYELPNGEIVTQNPLTDGETK
ncbi:hypothetical protein [Arsenicibacter rosenii]|uniref:Uncharacterized protein n=1 Tax=Arsenicibacter rosenii TaxID=1750698 RepID=A0A1S2VI09_9BACT|nr:hypothetical protein [Arsenicibacter rosenii]OIN57875.1 hypothetical protein BLX24_17415 [Arsenicibacter rosenii]